MIGLKSQSADAGVSRFQYLSDSQMGMGGMDLAVVAVKLGQAKVNSKIIHDAFLPEHQGAERASVIAAFPLKMGEK